MTSARLLRFGLPVAQAVLALVGLLGAPVGPRSALAAAGVVVVAGAVAWRPPGGLWLLPVLLLLVVLVSVECHGSAGNVGWFGVCLLAVWAGSTQSIGPALGFGVVCLLPFAVEQVIADDTGWGAWVAGTAVSTAAAVAGRHQGQLVAQLRDAQAGLADQAAAQERNRIARELHDVIGHALTVSLLHVTSARLALAEDPAEAATSLAEAERLAQRSLAEVRAVVGMMSEPGTTGPMPGAGQLEELVTSFRRAGADVEWRADGDLAALSGAQGLVVYRIVQEALTNAARHAPEAHTTATVRVDDTGTRVVVESTPVAGVPGGDGTGLRGMRERAEAVGGRLTAGPGGRGWLVEAVLP